jgi:peptidoglycan/LPS O-acetylase OafA/YrhL
LLPGGGAGVDIFFTLSGFLITSLLLEEHAETGRLRLRQFYMRRALRLVPAFALLLLVHFVYCLTCYRGWDLKASLAGGVISCFYLSNWSRAYKWVPHFGLSHTWSLAIEEQFYLLWPVLLLAILFLLKSQGGRLRAVAALAVAFVIYRALLIQWGAPFHRIYNGLDTRADALLIGCLTSFIYKTYPIKSASRSARLLGAAACLSLVLLLAYFTLGQDADAPPWYGVGFTLLSLASALVILGLIYEPPGWRLLSRLLKLRSLVWVGKVSYGLYLWHFFIVYAFKEQFPQASDWVVMPLAVGVSLAIATVSFYALEKPVLRWKNRFAWRAEPAPYSLSRGAGQSAFATTN